MATNVAKIADADMENCRPFWIDDVSLSVKSETVVKWIYHSDEVIAGRKIQPAQKVGSGWLWQSADLHGQNSIQLYHRPRPLWRNNRKLGARAMGPVERKCRVCHLHLWRAYEHADSALGADL